MNLRIGKDFIESKINDPEKCSMAELQEIMSYLKNKLETKEIRQEIVRAKVQDLSAEKNKLYEEVQNINSKLNKVTDAYTSKLAGSN